MAVPDSTKHLMLLKEREAEAETWISRQDACWQEGIFEDALKKVLAETAYSFFFNRCLPLLWTGRLARGPVFPVAVSKTESDAAIASILHLISFRQYSEALTAAHAV